VPLAIIAAQGCIRGIDSDAFSPLRVQGTLRGELARREMAGSVITPPQQQELGQISRGTPSRGGQTAPSCWLTNQALQLSCLGREGGGAAIALRHSSAALGRFVRDGRMIAHAFCSYRSTPAESPLTPSGSCDEDGCDIFEMSTTWCERRCVRAAVGQG